MLDCLILGDSIAAALHQFKPECQMQVKSGINTWQFNKKFKDNFSSDVVIISLGSNDHKYVKTLKELQNLRSKITASRVYWILPAGNNKLSEVNIQDVQIMVNLVAILYGDIVIPIRSLQPDKIHPSWNGYKQIIKEIR